MEPTIPLVVPEVNPEHLGLIDVQRDKGRDGFIVTNPNCSTIMMVTALAPLRTVQIHGYPCRYHAGDLRSRV